MGYSVPEITYIQTGKLTNVYPIFIMFYRYARSLRPLKTHRSDHKITGTVTTTLLAIPTGFIKVPATSEYFLLQKRTTRTSEYLTRISGTARRTAPLFVITLY